MVGVGGALMEIVMLAVIALVVAVLRASQGSFTIRTATLLRF
jgi:hypothetical protein